MRSLYCKPDHHRCYGGSKKCILVRGSSYKIQATARGAFTGIIAAGWNKLQILVKRSKYSPFGKKGNMVGHSVTAMVVFPKVQE